MADGTQKTFVCVGALAFGLPTLRIHDTRVTSTTSLSSFSGHHTVLDQHFFLPLKMQNVRITMQCSHLLQLFPRCALAHCALCPFTAVTEESKPA